MPPGFFDLLNLPIRAGEAGEDSEEFS